MYEERCRRAGDDILAAVAILDVAIAAMARRRGGSFGPATHTGPQCRLWALALKSDGHRGRVRVVVQPAARTNRPSIVWSCGLFWAGRLRDGPFDARDQPGVARPDAIGPTCRRRCRTVFRRSVRIGHHKASGHDVTAH